MLYQLSHRPRFNHSEISSRLIIYSQENEKGDGTNKLATLLQHRPYNLRSLDDDDDSL